jgi:hypothetical protein
MTKLGTFTQLSETNCIAEMPANNARQTLNTDVGELFDFTGSDLNKDQIVLVKQMLRRHHNAIAKNRDDLGLTNSAEHVINVQGNLPMKQRYRRFQGPLRHEIEVGLQK